METLAITLWGLMCLSLLLLSGIWLASVVLNFSGNTTPSLSTKFVTTMLGVVLIVSWKMTLSFVVFNVNWS